MNKNHVQPIRLAKITKVLGRVSAERWAWNLWTILAAPSFAMSKAPCEKVTCFSVGIRKRGSKSMLNLLLGPGHPQIGPRGDLQLLMPLCCVEGGERGPFVMRIVFRLLLLVYRLK